MTELVDFGSFHSRLRVFGVLDLNSALRIGAGGLAGPTESGLPVVKDVTGRPYIPGSSFKGVMRSHVESLLRALDRDPPLACLSTARPLRGEHPGCLTQSDVRSLKEDHDDPEFLSQAIMEDSCWTCRVFGAPWLASKVLVRDMPILEDTWLGRLMQRQGVAIDRDTETAGHQLLYELEAVPAGTAFAFELVVENATDAEQGLILLALREFENGRVSLGGGRSRGLGRVTLKLNWEDSERVDAVSLPRYLATGKGVTLDEKSERLALLNAFLEEAGVSTNA